MADEICKVDVMVRHGAKFYCTLNISYNPLLKFNPDDIYEKVMSLRPTLKYERGVVIYLKIPNRPTMRIYNPKEQLNAYTEVPAYFDLRRKGLIPNY